MSVCSSLPGGLGSRELGQRGRPAHPVFNKPIKHKQLDNPAGIGAEGGTGESGHRGGATEQGHRGGYNPSSCAAAAHKHVEWAKNAHVSVNVDDQIHKCVDWTQAQTEQVS